MKTSAWRLLGLFQRYLSRYAPTYLSKMSFNSYSLISHLCIVRKEAFKTDCRRECHYNFLFASSVISLWLLFWKQMRPLHLTEMFNFFHCIFFGLIQNINLTWNLSIFQHQALGLKQRVSNTRGRIYCLLMFNFTAMSFGNSHCLQFFHIASISCSNILGYKHCTVS